MWKPGRYQRKEIQVCWVTWTSVGAYWWPDEALGDSGAPGTSTRTAVPPAMSSMYGSSLLGSPMTPLVTRARNVDSLASHWWFFPSRRLEFADLHATRGLSHEVFRSPSVFLDPKLLALFLPVSNSPALDGCVPVKIVIIAASGPEDVTVSDES